MYVSSIISKMETVSHIYVTIVYQASFFLAHSVAGACLDLWLVLPKLWALLGQHSLYKFLGWQKITIKNLCGLNIIVCLGYNITALVCNVT